LSLDDIEHLLPVSSKEYNLKGDIRKYNQYMWQESIGKKSLISKRLAVGLILLLVGT